jgi:hypothetical protein
MTTDHFINMRDEHCSMIFLDEMCLKRCRIITFVVVNTKNMLMEVISWSYRIKSGKLKFI